MTNPNDLLNNQQGQQDPFGRGPDHPFANSMARAQANAARSNPGYAEYVEQRRQARSTATQQYYSDIVQHFIGSDTSWHHELVTDKAGESVVRFGRTSQDDNGDAKTWSVDLNVLPPHANTRDGIGAAYVNGVKLDVGFDKSARSQGFGPSSLEQQRGAFNRVFGSGEDPRSKLYAGAFGDNDDAERGVWLNRMMYDTMGTGLESRVHGMWSRPDNIILDAFHTGSPMQISASDKPYGYDKHEDIRAGLGTGQSVTVMSPGDFMGDALFQRTASSDHFIDTLSLLGGSGYRPMVKNGQVIGIFGGAESPQKQLKRFQNSGMQIQENFGPAGEISSQWHQSLFGSSNDENLKPTGYAMGTLDVLLGWQYGSGASVMNTASQGQNDLWQWKQWNLNLPEGGLTADARAQLDAMKGVDIRNGQRVNIGGVEHDLAGNWHGAGIFDYEVNEKTNQVSMYGLQYGNNMSNKDMGKAHVTWGNFMEMFEGNAQRLAGADLYQEFNGDPNQHIASFWNARSATEYNSIIDEHLQNFGGLDQSRELIDAVGDPYSVWQYNEVTTPFLQDVWRRTIVPKIMDEAEITRNVHNSGKDLYYAQEAEAKANMANLLGMDPSKLHNIVTSEERINEETTRIKSGQVFLNYNNNITVGGQTFRPTRMTNFRAEQHGKRGGFNIETKQAFAAFSGIAADKNALMGIGARQQRGNQSLIRAALANKGMSTTPDDAVDIRNDPEGTRKAAYMKAFGDASSASTTIGGHSETVSKLQALAAATDDSPIVVGTAPGGKDGAPGSDNGQGRQFNLPSPSSVLAMSVADDAGEEAQSYARKYAQLTHMVVTGSDQQDPDKYSELLYGLWGAQNEIASTAGIRRGALAGKDESAKYMTYTQDESLPANSFAMHYDDIVDMELGRSRESGRDLSRKDIRSQLAERIKAGLPATTGFTQRQPSPNMAEGVNISNIYTTGQARSKFGSKLKLPRGQSAGSGPMIAKMAGDTDSDGLTVSPTSIYNTDSNTPERLDPMTNEQVIEGALNASYAGELVNQVKGMRGGKAGVDEASFTDYLFGDEGLLNRSHSMSSLGVEASGIIGDAKGRMGSLYNWWRMFNASIEPMGLDAEQTRVLSKTVASVYQPPLDVKESSEGVQRMNRLQRADLVGGYYSKTEKVDDTGLGHRGEGEQNVQMFGREAIHSVLEMSELSPEEAFTLISPKEFNDEGGSVMNMIKDARATNNPNSYRKFANKIQSAITEGTGQEYLATNAPLAVFGARSALKSVRKGRHFAKDGKSEPVLNRLAGLGARVEALTHIVSKGDMSLGGLADAARMVGSTLMSDAKEKGFGYGNSPWSQFFNSLGLKDTSPMSVDEYIFNQEREEKSKKWAAKKRASVAANNKSTSPVGDAISAVAAQESQIQAVQQEAIQSVSASDQQLVTTMNAGLDLSEDQPIPSVAPAVSHTVAGNVRSADDLNAEMNEMIAGSPESDPFEDQMNEGSYINPYSTEDDAPAPTPKELASGLINTDGTSINNGSGSHVGGRKPPTEPPNSRMLPGGRDEPMDVNVRAWGPHNVTEDFALPVTMKSKPPEIRAIEQQKAIDFGASLSGADSELMAIHNKIRNGETLSDGEVDRFRKIEEGLNGFQDLMGQVEANGKGGGVFANNIQDMFGSRDINGDLKSATDKSHWRNTSIGEANKYLGSDEGVALMSEMSRLYPKDAKGSGGSGSDDENNQKFLAATDVAKRSVADLTEVMGSLATTSGKLTKEQSKLIDVNETAYKQVRDRVDEATKNPSAPGNASLLQSYNAAGGDAMMQRWHQDLFGDSPTGGASLSRRNRVAKSYDDFSEPDRPEPEFMDKLQPFLTRGTAGRRARRNAVASGMYGDPNTDEGKESIRDWEVLGTAAGAANMLANSYYAFRGLRRTLVEPGEKAREEYSRVSQGNLVGLANTGLASGGDTIGSDAYSQLVGYDAAHSRSQYAYGKAYSEAWSPVATAFEGAAGARGLNQIRSILEPSIAAGFGVGMVTKSPQAGIAAGIATAIVGTAGTMSSFNKDLDAQSDLYSRFAANPTIGGAVSAALSNPIGAFTAVGDFVGGAIGGQGQGYIDKLKAVASHTHDVDLMVAGNLAKPNISALQGYQNRIISDMGNRLDNYTTEQQYSATGKIASIYGGIGSDYSQVKDLTALQAQADVLGANTDAITQGFLASQGASPNSYKKSGAYQQSYAAALDVINNNPMMANASVGVASMLAPGQQAARRVGQTPTDFWPTVMNWVGADASGQLGIEQKADLDQMWGANAAQYNTQYSDASKTWQGGWYQTLQGLQGNPATAAQYEVLAGRTDMKSGITNQLQYGRGYSAKKGDAFATAFLLASGDMDKGAVGKGFSYLSSTGLIDQMPQAQAIQAGLLTSVLNTAGIDNEGYAQSLATQDGSETTDQSKMAKYRIQSINKLGRGLMDVWSGKRTMSDLLEEPVNMAYSASYNQQARQTGLTSVGADTFSGLNTEQRQGVMQGAGYFSQFAQAGVGFKDTNSQGFLAVQSYERSGQFQLANQIGGQLQQTQGMYMGYARYGNGNASNMAALDQLGMMTDGNQFQFAKAIIQGDPIANSRAYDQGLVGAERYMVQTGAHGGTKGLSVGTNERVLSENAALRSSMSVSSGLVRGTGQYSIDQLSNMNTYDIQNAQDAVQRKTQDYDFSLAWKQLGRQQASVTGVGLGAYAPGFEGKGQYYYEDAGISLGRRQQDFSYGQEEKSLGIKQQQMNYDLNYQQQGMTIQRGHQVTEQQWGMQDLSFQRNMNAIGFGNSMIDMDEAVRYSTGRQKRDAMRHRDEAVVQNSMQVGQMDREEDRAKQRIKWSDEQYSRELAHFNQSKQFQQQNFQLEEENHRKSREFMMESRKLEDEQRTLHRALAAQEMAEATQSLKIHQDAKKTMDDLGGALAVANRLYSEQGASMQYDAQVGDNLNLTLQRLGVTMSQLATHANVTYDTSGIGHGTTQTAFYSGQSGQSIVDTYKYMYNNGGQAPPTTGTQLQGSAGVPLQPATHVAGHGMSYGGPVGYELPGFAAGGSTGIGAKYEPAGIVHKGEFVVPMDGSLVRSSPQSDALLQKIVDVLERILAEGLTPDIQVTMPQQRSAGRASSLYEKSWSKQ